jgi:6-pyruvoyltetrahydropterin/6-carboxytetrahydropterin synthase
MNKKIKAIRYHDICCGHRVCGHENKCANLHGHNYRFHFTVEGEQDNLGRVMDFSVIKSTLCQWLEDEWDHRFLLWENDPLASTLPDIDPSVILVSFNPTAENMAEYIVEIIAPKILKNTGTTLTELTIDETRKCSVTYSL